MWQYPLFQLPFLIEQPELFLGNKGKRAVHSCECPLAVPVKVVEMITLRAGLKAVQVQEGLLLTYNSSNICL